MLSMPAEFAGSINAFGIWELYLQNKLLVSIGVLLMLFVISMFFRHRKNNKKKDKKASDDKVIRPITDVIGSKPERLAELNKELEPFGFSYEPYQDMFYSLLDGWQRKFGYCRLYDEAAAAFSMIIDCEPIPFEYNGVKYLIEFWKGQYGMTTGGEVGMYYTTGPSINIPGVFNGTFYNTLKDEDCINMSFAFRKNGNLLFTRSAYHWWITGFKLAEFSWPHELSMDIIMDLYDSQMAYNFGLALIMAGYTDEEFAVRGRRVWVRFNKPHTPQPHTRTAFTEKLMQKNNRALIESYRLLTNSYTNTLDKLNVVKSDSPNLYNKILNVGKPIEVFEAYNTINSFIKQHDKE